MNTQAFFDAVPLWAVFLLTLLAVGGVTEFGFRLGRRARARPSHEHEPQITLVITSVLGLVAFMLGSTLGLAESRYEARREAKFSEADAISTAYTRAALLPDSSRDTVRALLRQAAAVGVDLGDNESSEDAITALAAIRDSVWQIASAEANTRPQSQTIALFLESIGRVFDVFEREVFVARHGRIPVTIWAVLNALMMIAVGLLGYHSGVSGSRPLSGMTSLALALATVVCVIADLDRPHAGTLRLGRDAMTELHRAFTPDSRRLDSLKRR